jgi:hypothetical protein
MNKESITAKNIASMETVVGGKGYHKVNPNLTRAEESALKIAIAFMRGREKHYPACRELEMLLVRLRPN